MASTVRSYSKINLGLAIGPPRPDGFHALSTLYQTVALHDRLTVSARKADATRITLSSTHPRVPLDARNTVWKMVERALAVAGVSAEVEVHLQKNLPIQGGMGAGSANAAAALLGLERELGLELSRDTRLAVAAEVGSDVPLFLVGGSVLGSDRGQLVEPVADVALGGSDQIPCVIALPARGVSTPQAFRDWDARFAPAEGNDLQKLPVCDTLEKLSRTYASVFHRSGSGFSGNSFQPGPVTGISADKQDSPEKLHGLSREQPHQASAAESGNRNDPAESLLALVHSGIANDFETVVFLQYPLLGEIKRLLVGSPESGQSAVYAALSGSGSALFGLYRSQADAGAAQQRLQQGGVQAIVTTTLPRSLYWSNMFAE
jgi:4-diphosphocytidyl-2-C-methyl-D-erythritol kinase